MPWALPDRPSMLVLCAIGIAVAVPAEGHACSRFGFHAVRSARTAHFIGTPMADTVFAGAGSVRYVVMPGHSGPAGTRAVFGQLLSIEQIGGLASVALRQPVKHIVLVPWDYGADCTPTPWMRSAAWAQSGSRGLFSGVLRDSVHWAGGVPTFDVFTPETEPYPQQVQRQRARRLSADSLVPMEELFQLIELFPEERLLPDSAEAATQALFAWARANPTLTRRYPIWDALSRARSVVAMQRLRAIESPLTGTWRLTVSLSSDTALTFYGRTGRVPVSAWDSNGQRPVRVDDPTIVPRPAGYYLLTAVAYSIGALPQSCEGRDSDREAYIAVALLPPDSTREAINWTGRLETKLAERVFINHAALSQFSRAEFDAQYRRYRDGLPYEMPARFTQIPDGTLRVEQLITLEDGRSLTLSGLRISPNVIACR